MKVINNSTGEIEHRNASAGLALDDAGDPTGPPDTPALVASPKQKPSPAVKV